MCSIEGTTDHDVNIEMFCLQNKFRGPDNTSTYLGRDIQLGHNLLKISPNHKDVPQPFVTKAGNVLCYNGEIYGLEDDVFDTEWLAQKIEKEGVESLAKGVNGMWAFAWYDQNKNTITLCKDHFGQKPLYYLIKNVDGKDQLYFSSTITPLFTTLARLEHSIEQDEEAIEILKTNNGFNIGQDTVYKSIKRLMPGEILTIELGKKFKYKKDNLWNLDKSFNLFPNYMWNVEEFEHITKKAIKQVCRAPNIRKTLSLSGGLDSSLICSVGRSENISCCSVTWENKNIGEKDSERHLLSQLELARETCRKNAVNLNVVEIKHSQKNSPGLLTELPRAMGYIPTWDHQRLIPRFINITQAASKGNKIYITGDCADEILTGYNGDFNKWCDPKIHEKSNSHYLTKEQASKLDYVKEFSHLMSVDTINNDNFRNLITHCDGFCTVLDSMCGYYGMESRTPFLHQEFVKYALKIPGQEKLRIPYLKKQRKKGFKFMRDHQYFMLGHYKGLLRENFDGHYVDSVRNFDRKVGLSNPWNSRNTEINNTIIKESIYEYYKLALKWIYQLHNNDISTTTEDHVSKRPYLYELGVDFKQVIRYNEIIHEFYDEDIEDD